MWHVLASSFGITAAVLVVGGYVLLQWQRNRYRYRLMQTALEQGITNLSEGPPFWLISMRQGIAVLVLGLGLIIVGATAFTLAQAVETPEQPSTQSSVMKGSQEDSSSAASEEKMLKLLRLDRPKPPPSPAMEQWRRAQVQETVGLATIGCGFLIALLGLVRTVFAFVERKHFRNAGQLAT